MDEEIKMADPKWRLFETHEVIHTPYNVIVACCEPLRKHFVMFIKQNQNQSNNSGQSQRTQTNSKQVHVAGAKRGKTSTSESRLVFVF